MRRSHPNRWQPPGVLAAALLLSPGTALAHSPIPGLNHFYNGVLHPALVPSHALVTVALGLLCAQLPAAAGRRTLLAFLGGMVAGLVALALPQPTLATEPALLGGTLVLGLLLAAATQSAVRGLLPLAGVLGLCLGLDAGPDAAVATLDWSLGVAGQALGVLLIVSAALLLAARLERQAWQRVARQVLGSWIAASALMSLALRAIVQPVAS